MTTTITLLGSPRIERDGQPVDVDTRKAIGLLAYLVVTAAPQGRDTLAGLLWPDYEQERARASLRRTLSVLIKALGGPSGRGGVVADRPTVRYEPRSDIEVDLDRFLRLQKQAADADDPDERLRLSEEAAATYGGDFLAGFALRDAPPFDDWHFFTAETLRRDLAAVLEDVTLERADRLEWDAAIEHARRWLSLDPLHEPAHRLLMLLYARSGQRAAALRQYRECVRVLERELGVPPLDETEDLHRAVKESRIGPAAPSAEPAPAPAERRRPPAAARAVTPRHDAAPLRGRDRELEALAAAHEQDAGGCIVLVEGEPGVGKTRLVSELVARASRTGAPTLVMRCYEGEGGLAYAPVVQGLRTVLAEVPPQRLDAVPGHAWAEVARLVPEALSRAEGAAAEGPAGHARFLEGVATAIIMPFTGAPRGVIVVDDVHWADESSVDLLSYVLNRLDGRDVTLVLTARTEELPGDHRLRRIVEKAAAGGTAARIVLDRLDESAVGEMVRGALPDADPDLTARVYAETEGVPLFVHEYLAVLSGTTGGRAYDASAEWPVPAGVHGLLSARLGSVSPGARQLLSAAAVIGRGFDVDTLRAASGRSDDETLTGLEELLDRGLLREARGVGERGEPGYEFSHAKLLARVLEETSLARLRLLNRRVAEALEQRPGATSALQRGRIAGHWLQAGQTDRAALLSAEAGDAARAVYANAEALSMFETALGLGHPDPALLHERIGDLHMLAGAYPAAGHSYETAAALRTGPELAAAEHRLGRVHHAVGDWELAEDQYAVALDLVADGPDDLRARVLADAALTAHRRGDGETALARAEQALALAGRAGDEVAVAQALNLLGILAGSRGDADAAITHLEQSVEMAQSCGEEAVRAAALNNLALALATAGEPERALPLAEEALDVCRRVGDRHREAAVENNIADLLRALGRVQEAEERVRRAVTILAEIGAGFDELRPEIWKLTEW